MDHHHEDHPLVVTARTLACRHGVPEPTFRPVEQLGNSARAAVRHRRIEFGPGVQALPRTQRDWVAAHELAHIAAGHRPASGPLVGIGVMAAALGAVVAVVVVNLLTGAVDISPALLAATMTVGLVIGMGSLLWHLTTRRHQETEADTIARDWGHPVTAEIAEAIAAKELAHGIGPRWPVILSDHPKPHDRINDDQ